MVVGMMAQAPGPGKPDRRDVGADLPRPAKAMRVTGGGDGRVSLC